MKEAIKNIDLTRVTPETWPAYRQEIVKLFAEQEYGIVPDGWQSSTEWTGSLEKDGLHGKTGKVTVAYENRTMEIPFVLWLPETALPETALPETEISEVEIPKTALPAAKVPCIIYINGAPEASQSKNADTVHEKKEKSLQPVITAEMREQFRKMMKELIGDDEHFRQLQEDQKAQMGKGPSTLNTKEDIDSDIWPVRRLLAAGFATAAFSIFDLAPDSNETWKEKGLYPLFYGNGIPENPDKSFGCLAAWAFGASRVMDALLTCPEIDPARISPAGHSRCGKAALWAAVSDERFETVLSNNSGCCGAALNEGKHGENIESITRIFPAWFCRNFLAYASAASDKAAQTMPFDQDLLLAAMAPRPVYVTSGSRDYWSDPLAEFRSAKRAGEVYTALGLEGLMCSEYPAPDTASNEGMIGYALREGPHAITPWDWKMFCDFENAKQQII